MRKAFIVSKGDAVALLELLARLAAGDVVVAAAVGKDPSIRKGQT